MTSSWKRIVDISQRRNYFGPEFVRNIFIGSCSFDVRFVKIFEEALDFASCKVLIRNGDLVDDNCIGRSCKRIICIAQNRMYFGVGVELSALGSVEFIIECSTIHDITFRFIELVELLDIDVRMFGALSWNLKHTASSIIDRCKNMGIPTIRRNRFFSVGATEFFEVVGPPSTSRNRRVERIRCRSCQLVKIASCAIETFDGKVFVDGVDS